MEFHFITVTSSPGKPSRQEQEMEASLREGMKMASLGREEARELNSCDVAPISIWGNMGRSELCLAISARDRHFNSLGKENTQVPAPY